MQTVLINLAPHTRNRRCKLPLISRQDTHVYVTTTMALRHGVYHAGDHADVWIINLVAKWSMGNTEIPGSGSEDVGR